MKTIHALSIDIALGALACGLMAQWVLGVSMPLAWYFVLPAVVWLIYTADHLLDVKRIGSGPGGARHNFFREHISQINAAFSIVLVGILLLSIGGLGRPILFFGLLAGGLVGVYFLLVHTFRDKIGKWFQRELMVAVLYALGIWGGPLAVKATSVSVLELIFIFQLILLAFMNLLVYSLYDPKEAEHKGITVLVNQVGPENTSKRAYMVGFCVMVLSALLVPQVRERDLLVVIAHLVMALCLMGILKWKQSFRQIETYRIAADGIFFIPLLPILISLWLQNA